MAATALPPPPQKVVFDAQFNVVFSEIRLHCGRRIIWPESICLETEIEEIGDGVVGCYCGLFSGFDLEALDG